MLGSEKSSLPSFAAVSVLSPSLFLLLIHRFNQAPMPSLKTSGTNVGHLPCQICRKVFVRAANGHKVMGVMGPLTTSAVGRWVNLCFFLS